MRRMMDNIKAETEGPQLSQFCIIARTVMHSCVLEKDGEAESSIKPGLC
jgi:hypothetical protein